MIRAMDLDEYLGCWSPEVPREAGALEAWQLERAWRIATILARDNPFYRDRLHIPAERTAEAFRRLPLTRKADVVRDCEAYPPYGSRTTCSPHRIRMVVQTGGTSGRGTEIYALDEADEAAIVRVEAVGFRWAGVGDGTRVLLTIPVGMTAAGLWYYAALRFLGANVFSVGAYPTERKVEVLRRYGADVVVGTPSYIHRLAVSCEDEGVDPRRLGVSALLVAGEPYTARWARDIEERWGAVLYEQYGCTERAIGWTCPGGVVDDEALGVLHFPPEGGYVEVIDPATAEPVRHGRWGELVVTPFGADASPLVRYATGDRVLWMAPGSCPCGRPLAGIAAGQVQRFDDMMKIRGINVWPVAFDSAILGVDGVRDYRGVVRRRSDGGEAIELHVECEPARAGEIAGLVSNAVRRTVGLGVIVHPAEPGALSRNVPEGFVKVKRWRDERMEGMR